jgi:hypothetical protein
MIWNVSKLIWSEWHMTTPKWRSLICKQGIIIDLEQTCQDFREQQVATHIEFEREKQNLTTQI